MGSTGSKENKEETTVKKEDNTNEVVYHQDGMKVINIHGETVLISLAATAIMIFFLLALYKFMQRRGCWKKRKTPERETEDQRRQHEPSQQEIKEQEKNMGHPGDWDGIQKEP